MKTSEVIHKLQELLKSDGDLDMMYMADGGFGMIDIDDITVKKDGRRKVFCLE